MVSLVGWICLNLFTRINDAQFANIRIVNAIPLRVNRRTIVDYYSRALNILIRL